ncbi:DUF6183 family protein [Embleya sp. NPDC005575]|uniref:DUF6183 family protein n=1 Tax=Embleya sp. NPDC005575 TaxID=3156892 RepID=UPI0033AC3C00
MKNSADVPPTDEELWRLTWETAEPRAAQGDVGFVRELGSTLLTRLAAVRQQTRDHERCLGQVTQVLATTPGPESVGELLQLLREVYPYPTVGTTSPRAGGGSPAPRHIASMLVACQSYETLERTVFDRSVWDNLHELRDCLFHELLMRDAIPGDSWTLRGWQCSTWTPLRWLPTERRDFEIAWSFPEYHARGMSWSGGISGPPAEKRVDPPMPRTAEPSHLRNAATSAEYQAIVAAGEAGNWGCSEAWVFRLDKPVEPGDVPALLPSLPMGCVEGLGPEGRFEIGVSTLDDVWPILFSTASTGGMYGPPSYGAYGRFAAWCSVAGLSGAAHDASADEVETLARGTTWFRFASGAEWFHNEVGHDYGIAALSPDRRRLAVLAATDTD